MIELLAGLLLLLAIVGSVIPFLPGPLLAAVAVLGCAVITGERTAWVAAGIALGVLIIGWVAKWIVPARHVQGDVHPWAIAIGGVAALIGFFVIPIVGLPIGFVVGVLATELVRTQSVSLAWPATRQAIKAAGLSMLIELASVVLAAALWTAVMVLY